MHALTVRGINFITLLSCTLVKGIVIHRGGNPFSESKNPPQYFVFIVWVCKLAHIFRQEVELISEPISWVEVMAGRNTSQDFHCAF